MDLKGVIDRFPNAGRKLAIARLRHRVIDILQISLKESGKSQTQLAEELGVSRSAVSQVFVGDGNLRISTLAEYLYGMGHELQLKTVPAGTVDQKNDAPTIHIAYVTGVTPVPQMVQIDFDTLAIPMTRPVSARNRQALLAHALDSAKYDQLISATERVGGITNAYSQGHQLPQNFDWAGLETKWSSFRVIDSDDERVAV